jgi:hypothetical protein
MKTCLLFAAPIAALAAHNPYDPRGLRAPRRAADPVQCAYPTDKGCGRLTWPVAWSMRGSLYTYCYIDCPLGYFDKHRDLGVFAGVVGVDHYWTHQGMPCIDGVPQEFEAQDAFARATKASFPGTRILEYRITDAVPYTKVVHDAMVEHPDWFVRWHHEPNANGSICVVPPEAQTGRPGDNCSWPIQAAAYDFSNPVVREWYQENIIKPVMVAGDGVWLERVSLQLDSVTRREPCTCCHRRRRSPALTLVLPFLPLTAATVPTTAPISAAATTTGAASPRPTPL